MKKKSIMYISTNGMWSGSEELWSRSAECFSNLDYNVTFATRFESQNLLRVTAKHLNFSNRYNTKSFLKRGLERISNIKFYVKDLLREFIINEKPGLVIISQGNNYESADIMELCMSLNIKYITITQLVSEFFIFMINDTNSIFLEKMYSNSIKNYFVSYNNLNINNFLLGSALQNSEIIYNPCKLTESNIPIYPTFEEKYCIGLVGRIECWHKGYDLFLQVVDQEKWKKRPIIFNIYGEGPHTDFIKSYIVRWRLHNVVFKGYSSDVSKIWKENQIMLLPSRMEGQALALIEAMWCQRAVIATNVGGAKELIDDGKNGFIAEEVTTKSIDEALERAWNHRDDWEIMGRKAAVALKNKYPADAVDFFNQQVLNIMHNIN